LIVKISIAQRFRRAAVSVAGSQNRINIQHFIINASVLFFDPCFSPIHWVSCFDVILHHQYELIFEKQQFCTFGLPAPQMKVSKDTKNVIILLVTGILGGW